MSERELMRRVNRGMAAGMMMGWAVTMYVGHVMDVTPLSGLERSVAITACIVGALIYFSATDGYTGDE